MIYPNFLANRKHLTSLKREDLFSQKYNFIQLCKYVRTCEYIHIMYTDIINAYFLCRLYHVFLCKLYN